MVTSKFLESFKGKWVDFNLLTFTGMDTRAGYLIDEDETYYYLGYSNRIEVEMLVTKSKVSSVDIGSE